MVKCSAVMKVLGSAVALPLLAGAVALSPAGAAKAPSLRAANVTSLSGLSNTLKAEEKLTFKASYILQSSPTSAKSSVTFEQKPPNSLEKTATATVLNLGSKSYFCGGGAKPTCIEESNSPFASEVALFDPAEIVTELQSLQEEVALKVAGISVSSSSKSVDGQSTQCETVKVKTGSSTWCVTGKGVLAYATGSSGSVVQLSSYSTSVPASDFKLPSGATISTVPAIP